MDKVNFVKYQIDGEEQIHAVIEHLDGSLTSMLKSTYDELSALEAAPE